MKEGADAGGITALGFASSDDGVTWTKYAANPVLERSGPVPAWDASGVILGPILDEGDHGTMLFGSGDFTAPTLSYRYGLATSPYLETWMRTTQPLFESGDASSWERAIGGLTLVQEGEGYRLWYEGWDAGILMCIGTATSSYGLAWVKGAANPVMVTGAPGSWNERSIDVQSLTLDGSMYKMTVWGVDAAMNMCSFGEAYSADDSICFYRGGHVDNSSGGHDSRPSLPSGLSHHEYGYKRKGL